MRNEGRGGYWRPSAANVQILETSKDEAHKSADEDDEEREVVTLVEAKGTVYFSPETDPGLSKGGLGVVP